ncbi:hypothetical protein F383_38294 [Gossypium arboreum]|uniref:Uncharacterized protein n=1 Tax=Gossypium arboreum TaxID=29729 RepID=A0A0B0MJZ3_GOSAR|nr:hypothetical protein F383_38294 [Gossypium arboreum]
MPLSQIGSYS